MRVRLGVLLAAVGGISAIGAGEAAALEFCDRAASGRSCATLTVPLDRSGAVPGTVKLRIERQRAKRSTRPPLFMLAGGPGQSATRAFDSDVVDQVLRTEARSRDVVVMDVRGTGGSGALMCPALQRGSTRAADIAACAARLGARRDFYSSTDIAADIDAVREALGAERIALYGVSYGTHVAQVYARLFPARVERLLLDSVVGPGGVDAFERPSMAALPRIAANVCGRRLCRGFTRDAALDLTRLAARLDSRPLRGHVFDARGRRRPATIDGQGLLGLFDASVTPFGLGSALPGAIRSALHGDPTPLLRLHRVSGGGAPPGAARELSAAAYVATLCADTQLPWDASVPIGSRGPAAASFVATLPAGAFAPFGSRTALRSSVLRACQAWPSPVSGRVTPVLGPLPDVPALLIAGGLDVRTPLESTRAVAAQMPRAGVVAVGHATHSVLGQGFSRCPGDAARRFLAGGGPPARCGPGPRLIVPYPVAPRSLHDLRAFGGRPRRTAGAVAYTTIDVGVGVIGALMQLDDSDPSKLLSLVRNGLRAGALRGGSYTLHFKGPAIGFDRASAVPGVRVSGRLRTGRSGLTGAVRVTGPAAAHGRLTFRGDLIRGRLGGRPVRLRLAAVGRLLGTPALKATAAAGPADIAAAARTLISR